MERDFFSSKYYCPNDCLYCFAKWDIYKCNKFPNLEICREADIKDDFAIYPVCDSECVFDEPFFDFLNYFLSRRNDLIVSVSKKNAVSGDILEKIRLLNQAVAERRNYAAISVSFSNITRIDEIEKGCAGYMERLDFLESLNAHSIPHNVIIKPILPFIETDEYMKIIDDTIKFSSTYVLGGLYINKDKGFYKSYIEGKFEISQRPVSWLKSGQSWFVVESEKKKNELSKYIEKIGGHCFDSDVEAVKYAREVWFKNHG